MQVGTWNLGSKSGKRVTICEEQRMMIDVCCEYEIRWRREGSRMLWMKVRRYKLWWSVKGDGVGGVGVMVKELCEKVIEVRRVSDRVKTVVVVLEENVLRLICGYAPQSGRTVGKNSLL